jgi:hypothetical protein
LNEIFPTVFFVIFEWLKDITLLLDISFDIYTLGYSYIMNTDIFGGSFFFNKVVCTVLF